MARKGLSKEKIIEASINFIREKGYENFSIRELAESLGCNPSSLYNHIDSLEDVNTAICLTTINQLAQWQKEAIDGKAREEAVTALSLAYRRFAKENRELYKIVMTLPAISHNNKIIEEEAEQIIKPIMQVLDMYQVSDEMKMDYQRFWRSILHGFIDQEEAGYFSHFPVDIEYSYNLAIKNLLLTLEIAESNYKAK